MEDKLLPKQRELSGQSLGALIEILDACGGQSEAALRVLDLLSDADDGLLASDDGFTCGVPLRPGKRERGIALLKLASGFLDCDLRAV